MHVGNKNFLVYSTFVLALLSFVYGEPTDSCLDLIWEMRNCSNEFHIPENCDDSTQSKLYTCAEAVADKLSQCPDKIAQKMIKYFVTAYKTSDQVICENNMHAEFMNDSECAKVAKVAVVHMAYFTPGFITKKGCRVFKTAILIAALARDQNTSNCFNTVKDYLDIMYSKSTCNATEVETPTTDDVLNLRDVFMHIHMCWVIHRKVPKCDGSKTRRLQCVENQTINRIKNANMKTLENNILNVTVTTDRVICENEELKKNFESNRGCLQHTRSLGGFLIAEVNGYYTEEGCEGLKYREKYQLAVVDEDCRPILQTYWHEVKKILPCFEGEPSSSKSHGEKVKFSIIFLVLTMSVTYLT